MAIVSWNINGLKRHKADLLSFIDENLSLNYIVLNIQETHRFDPFCLNGYNHEFLSSPPGVKASRGLTTYIKKGYHYEPMAINSPNIDVIAIKIFHPYEMVIANVYIPPNKKVDSTDFTNLFSQLSNTFCIMGDINAHNSSWSISKPNKTGKILQDLIIQTDNLIIMNDGSPTHLSTHNTFTSPDICICTKNLSSKFYWTVSEDFYSCDHAPQSMIYSNNRAHVINNFVPITRFSFDRADWSRYNLELDFHTDFSNCVSTPAENMELFVKEMVCAAKNAIPIKKQILRFPKFWWTKEIGDAIRERKRLCKKARKCKTEMLIIDFKRARAKVKFLIKCSIERKNRETAELIQFKKSSKIAWDYTNRLRGKRVSNSIKTVRIGSKWISDPQEVVEFMANELNSFSNDSNYPPEFLPVKYAEENNPISINLGNSETYNEPFKLFELENAIKNLKKSAAGPDEVYNEMIKNLDFFLRRKLLTLINSLWNTGELPDSFTEAHAIALPKPDGGRRYISLTSCLGKLMEKLVTTRLQWWLENRKFFDNYQAGFRRNRSTLDNLVKLDSDIKISLEKGQRTVAIFFDLNKAYDITWRHLIMKILQEYGVDGKMLQYCQNFMSNRKFKVLNGNTASSERLQKNGVPQGGVLSVVLFLIAMESLKKIRSKNSGVNILTYADDIVAYISHKDKNVIQSNLQNLLKDLEEWCRMYGFSFSVRKTKAMEFRQTKRKPWKVNLMLNNTNLEYVPNYKFLGLNFNCYLSWNHHIQDLIVRTRKDINLMKLLASPKWRLSKTDLITIFNSICMSKIDYGDFIYSSQNSPELKKLQRVQNEGLRCATGLFRTTKIDSILKISGQKDLEFSRKIHMANYFSKIKCVPKHPNLADFKCQRLKKTFEKSKSILKPTYLIAKSVLDEWNVNLEFHLKNYAYDPWKIENIFFDLSMHTTHKDNLTTTECKQQFREMSAKYSHCFKVYTDGSVAQENAGYGIFCEIAEIKIKIRSGSTVFTTEAEAIYHAIKIATTSTSLDQVAIFSDSMSCIIALKNYYNRSSQIQQIFNLLYRHQNIKFHFIWIPSHRGIEENENADALARSSLELTQENGCYHLSDGLSRISRLVNKEWDYLWNQRNSSYFIYKAVNGSSIFNITELEDRTQTVRLDRVRTGVTKLTHIYIIEKSEPPNCRRCGQRLTIPHLIQACDQLEDERNKFGGICSAKLNGEMIDINNIRNYMIDIGFWSHI